MRHDYCDYIDKVWNIYIKILLYDHGVILKSESQQKCTHYIIFSRDVHVFIKSFYSSYKKCLRHFCIHTIYYSISISINYVRVYQVSYHLVVLSYV